MGVVLPGCGESDVLSPPAGVRFPATGEIGFICLSFTSKALLAWMNYVSQSVCFVSCCLLGDMKGLTVTDNHYSLEENVSGDRA